MRPAGRRPPAPGRRSQCRAAAAVPTRRPGCLAARPDRCSRGAGAAGTAAVTATADPDAVAAARLLLARLGLTATDLLDTDAPASTVPTFAEYVPVVAASVNTGTRRVYGS